MNIFIINTDKAKLYPQMMKKYIETKGFVCYISKWREAEINSVISAHNLTPLNTLIHARTAGPHITDTYKKLEDNGFTVINKSTTTDLTSNKYNSQVFAAKHGIPVPQIYKLSKQAIKEIKNLADKYGSIVAKPIYSQGQGIFCRKIDNTESVAQMSQTVADIPGEEIIIQEYVPYVKLIRTIVVGYKILKGATAFDVPAKDEWKSSVCMNPKIKKYLDCNDKLINLAEQTAKSFEAEVSFIDFFELRNGKYILNELNTACGLIIHEDITNIKIHQHIVNYLVHRGLDLNLK